MAPTDRNDDERRETRPTVAGQLVLSRRKEKKWSRDALARRTMLATHTIWRIERGEQRIGRKAAKALARELGIAISDLLDDARAA